MKTGKKFFALALSAILLLSLAACGSTRPATVTTVSTTASTTAATTEAAQPNEETTEAVETTETEAAANKTLVVYYSASGNTHRVAEAIAQAANADLFEIVPTEVYTNEDLNWTNPNSRVSREHDDESLRDIALTRTTPANWDEYDTVFIGYPIWWGIAAWPVDTFVKANDFTGKTVIPFCTSASSGIGESGALLAEMAGSGDWQQGQRFSSGVSEADVQAWVNGLGL